ncbi:MAG: ribonuclease, partial [Thermotogae bacterium]
MDTCLIISREDKTINAALVADGNLQEVFFEGNEFHSGNIDIGRVEKIVPGLNAAFIKIGPGKSAFLKLKEVTKRYLKDVLSASKISEGMKVLVQVKHDPVESKGAQV